MITINISYRDLVHKNPEVLSNRKNASNFIFSESRLDPFVVLQSGFLSIQRMKIIVS
jgi:hypothetical protein